MFHWLYLYQVYLKIIFISLTHLGEHIISYFLHVLTHRLDISCVRFSFCLVPAHVHLISCSMKIVVVFVVSLFQSFSSFGWSFVRFSFFKMYLQICCWCRNFFPYSFKLFYMFFSQQKCVRSNKKIVALNLKKIYKICAITSSRSSNRRRNSKRNHNFFGAHTLFFQ